MRAARRNWRYEASLWIDRWIGPGVCALLLLVAKLSGGFRPRLVPVRVEKILVLKLWGMGSIVLASPMLRRLRERYPDARIDFLSLHENAAILHLLRDVDRPLTLDLERGIPFFLARTLRMAARLRRERYDLLYDLEFFTRYSAIFSYLVAAQRSHGFSAKGRWRGQLHDVEVPFNAYHHVAANFLTLMRPDPMDPVDEAALAADDALPMLEVGDPVWRECAAELSRDPAWREGRPTVVVNPNAGDMALERRWPKERVAELLKHICGQLDVNVVVVGSASERAHAEAVVAASSRETRIVNLCGRIDVPMLVALLGRADVVVTNDSGPLHLAAAAGASTVALFGPETPTLYGPLRSQPGQRHVVEYLGLACSPCMFIHDNKVLSCWFAQARCMMGIEPAVVFASVDRLLREARGGGRDASRLRVIDS